MEGTKNLVMMGIQGSGKGTQSHFVAQEFEYRYFETGDIIRQHIAEGTEIGRKISALVQRGNLISDELVNAIAEDFIMASPDPFILDGYPRNMQQKIFLDELLKKLERDIHVIFIDVPADIALNRIQKRRICTQCRKVHLGTVDQTTCNFCNGELESRVDDQDENAIRRRMSEFEAKTLPVIQAYEQEGKAVRIEGVNPPEQVTYEILLYLKS